MFLYGYLKEGVGGCVGGDCVGEWEDWCDCVVG